jgi:hypothetical protein
MIQSNEGTMRIFKNTLIVLWLLLAGAALLPAGVVVYALGQVSDRYVATGLLPFTDGPAEQHAIQWLEQRGKRNVTIKWEIDPYWPDCPRRTRCYYYTATDAAGRYEEGQVFTKPSDLTVAQN